MAGSMSGSECGAGVISPLLPKSCRFLPTCSEYSMRAYREYGTARGTALTVWRVLRCNPLSEGGFDPPRWPPPGLDWLFGCGPGRLRFLRHGVRVLDTKILIRRAG